jgi:hypothetical protein
MKRIVIIMTCLLLSVISFGQITFQKTYGLVGYNYGRCAYQTDDGGYIILGNISGLVGNTDIYLIKTDSLGKIKWDKAIGGKEIDWANDLKITHDKGFIIAGYTDIVPGNGYDVLLIKTDSSGNVKWEKTFGGTDWDMGYSVAEDKEHNFLIAGETFSNSYGDADVYLIKTDSIGDTLWTKHYGGAGTDIGYSIDTIRNSRYLVAGITRVAGDSTYSAYLLKILNNGDTVWTKKYSDTFDNKFYCARQIDNTGYIVCGATKKIDPTNYHQWILKMDTLGDTIWTRVYPHTGSEELFDIKQSWNHGLVTAGYTTTFGGGGEDVTATIFSNAGWWIDIGGNFGGEKDDIAYSINLTRDSGYICTGTTESFGLGITNIYVIKTDKSLIAPSTPTQETGITEIISTGNFSCTSYPNPTNGKLFIKINNVPDESINLKVINIWGMELISENFKSVNSYCNKTVNLSAFPDGIYFIQISDNKFSSSLKIIKQTSR